MSTYPGEMPKLQKLLNIERLLNIEKKVYLDLIEITGENFDTPFLEDDVNGYIEIRESHMYDLMCILRKKLFYIIPKKDFRVPIDITKAEKARFDKLMKDLIMDGQILTLVAKESKFICITDKGRLHCTNPEAIVFKAGDHIIIHACKNKSMTRSYKVSEFDGRFIRSWYGDLKIRPLITHSLNKKETDLVCRVGLANKF